MAVDGVVYHYFWDFSLSSHVELFKLFLVYEALHVGVIIIDKFFPNILLNALYPLILYKPPRIHVTRT